MGMTNHRLSFWKTTAASAAVALVSVLLLAGLLVWVWASLGEARFWAACLVCILAVLLIAPLIIVSGLVATGGFIALRRDSFEARGQPYAQPAPRETTPHFLVAAIRAVSGRERSGFRPGDLVEIRGLDEILRTLDDKGTLDGLPFMPEMAARCGSRARVFRRVDKLNDWVHGTGLKRMRGIVLLEGLRCDGSAHGNCQSVCHLRWQEAWLRPVGRAEPSGSTSERGSPTESQRAALAAFASRQNDAGTDVRFVCQATELTAGGTPLHLTDLRHYARDFLTGNVRLQPLCKGIAIALFNRVQRKSGGPVFPRYAGGTSSASLHETLDLQPGELVRVKTKSRIELTLNNASRNRGLWFDREMLRFCGGKYRVKARVERLIIEKTGELRVLTNPCIILEGVIASGEYQGFNPENEYIFWHEIWLERIPPAAVG